MSAPVHYLSIADLSEQIRSRALSPVSAVQSQLDRIEELDPLLNCYVFITREQALSEAAKAEAEIRRGAWRGRLHGVPIALKDLFETAFAPTTAGTPGRRHVVPPRTAMVVQQLQEAGAIVLGKLAMTEGAFSEHRAELPVPRNPWGPDYWPGTSSSGSAVATAAGLCFGALATDTGGSIRYPAACSGVTGFMPTRSLVSRQGVVPLAESLDHVGVMARSAHDCAILLTAIAGAEPAGSTSLEKSRVHYEDFVGRGIEGVRIGIDPDYTTVRVAPEIVAAMGALRPILESQGAEFRNTRVPAFEPACSAWIAICAFEAAASYRSTPEDQIKAFGKALSDLIAMGRRAGSEDMAGHFAARTSFSAGLDSVFEDVDLLLVPVMPFNVPTWAERMTYRDRTALQRFTGPFNLSGSPTITFPAGFDARGMPIGLQLIGRHLSEELLLARAVQCATSWHARRPPVERLITEARANSPGGDTSK